MTVTMGPLHPISTLRIRQPKLRTRTTVGMKTPTAHTTNTVSSARNTLTDLTITFPHIVPPHGPDINWVRL